MNRPKVLLLDEPLGALDLKLRQEMQIELKSIQREVGITFVYVTHDQEEALTMSDRLAVFNQGRIEQIGPPAEVYEHPQSEFIAGFVGVSNVIERDGRRYTVRPEKINLLEDGERARGRARTSRPGLVRDVQYVGPVTRYHVTLDRGGELQVLAQNLDEGSSEVLEAKGRRVRAGVAPGAGVGHRRIGGRNRMKGRKHASLAGRASACSSRRSASSLRAAAAATTRASASTEIEGLGASVEEIQELAREEGEVNIVHLAGLRRSSSTSSRRRRDARSTRRTARASDDMITLMADGRVRRRRRRRGTRRVRLMATGEVAPINDGPHPQLRRHPRRAQGPGAQHRSTA